jgi:hypothetical protein
MATGLGFYNYSTINVVEAAPQAKASQSAAVSTKLAENGRALLPIVISAQAGEREKAAAQTLSTYLKRTTGADFKVESPAAIATTTPGIVLGTAARFNTGVEQFKLNDPTAVEDYLLRSRAGGVTLIGATEQALEHAVWDFLYELGHRQFFPGEKWEVVPSTQNLSVAVDRFEHPDFNSRLIWPGFGYLPENRERAAEWGKRNRAVAGIRLNTGHAYGNIIRRNKAEFDQHPEYLTKPGGGKFCVSEPGLQQLVIKDSLEQLEKNPDMQSISLDPTDGGGWESDSCRDAQVYKNVTDRAVTLANVVAEAIAQKYPDKFIGIYAYNEHSPPPTIAVHPRVIPSIATSFIRGGFTLEELFTGWSAKATHLGVREYYSVSTWDRDLPGRARGSNLDYLKRTIVDFSNKKARFMSAEASDNWGPNGLGYYIAARLMWDTSEAANVEALTDDFLSKAFGTAKEPMGEFYRLIDGSNKPLLSSDLVGRMYRQLDKAMQSTQDAAVHARLHDLVLYTRYVELYSAYTQANGAARQAAFEQVMRYIWRIRGTHMVHTLAIWRDNRDKAVKFAEGADYRTPEPKNPWKSSEPYSAQEIQTFITEGIANNKLLDFVPASFSTELVPATALNLTGGRQGSFNMLRGNQHFYTWVTNTPTTLAFQATGGNIYRDRGEAKFELYPAAEAEMKSVAVAEVVPDKAAHDVRLETNFPGMHRVSISDGSAGTSINWPQGVPLVFESSLENNPNLAGGRWTMVFYVPKGTKTVGGYRSGQGTILDGSGKAVLKLTDVDNPGFWSVPVAPGQDGKVWTLSSVTGRVMLMTVPPYIARSAAELLLPKEVVEADSKG